MNRRSARQKGGTQERRGDEVEGLYDQWAYSYDADHNRTRDLAGSAIRSDLAGISAGVIVELGCGTGVNTEWLVERARFVVAVDFSSAMLERARRRLEGNETVRFLRQDIRAPLQVPTDSADLVVLALVLEHIEDVAAVVAECRRVLRTGGYLYICELHPFRQWLGGQANFVDASTSGTVKLPAFRHDVSEYLSAGLGSGFDLVSLDEPKDELDRREGAPPRLLSLLFRVQ